jgi:hypothetical protein
MMAAIGHALRLRIMVLRRCGHVVDPVGRAPVEATRAVSLGKWGLSRSVFVAVIQLLCYPGPNFREGPGKGVIWYRLRR